VAGGWVGVGAADGATDAPATADDDGRVVSAGAAEDGATEAAVPFVPQAARNAAAPARAAPCSSRRREIGVPTGMSFALIGLLNAARCPGGLL
jgi:hypothetical protein